MKRDNRTKVAVFFGGPSPEHEVSVITGIQILSNLDLNKYLPVPVYLSKAGDWFIGSKLENIENFRDINSLIETLDRVILVRQQNKFFLVNHPSHSGLLRHKVKVEIDIAYPAFHGGVGENGSIQGLFETLGLAYVGSGPLSSALGMDKVLMKQIFQYYKLPLAKYLWFYRSEIEEQHTEIMKQIEKELRYPIFVKPACAGSSIGVTQANNFKQLASGLELASAFDQKVVVEEGFTDAREINISVLGNSGGKLETSVPEEVFGTGQFLSYQDKYQTKGAKSSGMVSARRKVPADLPADLSKKLAESAKMAFQALECSGLARIDFLVREKDQKYIVLEINTIPGSMAFYLWKASGKSFTELNNHLIELAFQRQDESNKNTLIFPSNILQNFTPSLKTGA